ncbi:hypothetical protein PMAYCL1PPCAC_25782, partial [Pristionchus mayeri]
MRAGNLHAGYSFSKDLTVLSLAYKDTSYSFVVLMPNGDFEKWLKDLTAKNMQKAIDNLEWGKIDLDLPKFKIESAIDAKAVLQKIGVNTIFSKDSANFSGISDRSSCPRYSTRLSLRCPRRELLQWLPLSWECRCGVCLLPSPASS